MTDPLVAPWIAEQTGQLLTQAGHAWLLHGASGLGQYELAISLVRAWLCEKPDATGACGKCTSCHAVDVRTHADLLVLMPETRMMELGWPLDQKAQSEIDDKKRKASREIRIDSMRDAIEFAQRTSARGRGKAILVYPAEDMNVICANALLKTLEEPPGDVRFVLASASAQKLLPTIRSRCLGHVMQWPSATAALSWLLGQGISPEKAPILLRAAAGRPDEAMAFHAGVRDAVSWVAFPEKIASNQVEFIRNWSVHELADALQKLCHDQICRLLGVAPRFFPIDALVPTAVKIDALSDWNKALVNTLRSIDHPFNTGLMQEALVGQAQFALNSRC
jgi:DNA polymerase-3 subunit delta'